MGEGSSEELFGFQVLGLLREQVDQEIRSVLDEKQRKRFGELMEKRGKRFPLGGPGSRFRKGEGRRD